MPRKLRGLILGSGEIARGHARALRRAGVEIVGLASRAAKSGAKLALKLRIPQHDSDWRKLLVETRPEIVAVATPAATHTEMAMGALEAGCHVFCDPPLATTAADAKALYSLAEARGLKTAYAAGSWYQPQALYAREIVRSGELGKILEIEAVSHFHWPTLLPFGWPHRLDLGGGRLNSLFPQLLAITQSILQEDVLACMGESRNDVRRAPVVRTADDIRKISRKGLTSAQAAKLKWAKVDSDWSFTALLRLGDLHKGVGEATSATFRHSGLALGRYSDYFTLFGEKGTLHTQGALMQGPMFIKTDGPTWEDLAIPLDILDSLPDVEDPAQRSLDQLAREFVADVRGKERPRYLTFRDGWIYQELIETIRSNGCWSEAPR